jgi:hypothetical protein
MTLIPAYGRDYKSKKAVEEDWKSGKDFIVADITDRYYGRYFNIESAKEAEIDQVNIRYKKLTQVCVLKAK